jgi:hypothetical protein
VTVSGGRLPFGGLLSKTPIARNLDLGMARRQQLWQSNMMKENRPSVAWLQQCQPNRVSKRQVWGSVRAKQPCWAHW